MFDLNCIFEVEVKNKKCNDAVIRKCNDVIFVLNMLKQFLFLFL
jgi:hypothetical protein